MNLEKVIETEFRKELDVLLKKYDASIELSQRGGPYMEYDVIEIYIESQYNKSGEKVRDSIEFDY